MPVIIIVIASSDGIISEWYHCLMMPGSSYLLYLYDDG
jgi:hypothetical protein